MKKGIELCFSAFDCPPKVVTKLAGIYSTIFAKITRRQMQIDN